jgi:alpha-2-macroglobulin
MLSFDNSKPRWLMLLCLCILLIPFVIQSGASGQQGRPFQPRVGGKEMGLKFRLSEGKEATKQQPQVSVPAVEPLSDEAAQNLLKRLPPIKTESGDEKEFALRDRSLPPPRTGQTIREAFPPSSSLTAPEKTTSGPLEVLRFAPEGEVPIAPHLSITFSQPIVAVTSNDDLSTAQVPAKLSPQPQGRWRWLGTKTLLFDPAGRLPMATEYTVEIAAGTKSVSGGVLAQAKRWIFSTPPPKVTLSHPVDGPHKRNPVFFLAFDQRIDPDVVLKHIRLSGGGSKDWRLRLATAEEVAADETASRLSKQTEPGRWLAFRVVTPSGANEDTVLPGSTNFTVTVEPGTPSAEGPRKTGAAQGFQFNTYAPLALAKHRCGYDRSCEPGMPFMLEFNNSLDPQSFDQKQIRVEPEFPGMRVNNYGNVISLQGATKGRTTYQVAIDAAVKDEFGQTLGQNKTVAFNVGPASPAVAASGEGLGVVDPFGAPRFSVFSINHQQLKVSLYSVSLENWSQYTEFMRTQTNVNRRGGQIPKLKFGRLISSDVVNVASKQDDLAETSIDLKPALKEGVGHVLAIVDAVQPPQREYERRSVIIWLQATNIGLDAFVDHSDVLGWATSLKDGKPLNDVELTLRSEGGAERSSGRTNAEGLARIQLPGEPVPLDRPVQTGKDSLSLLVARQGDDIAFQPSNTHSWMYDQMGWMKRKPYGDFLKWHVFDDRGMYRPGEEVHIKGWVRRIGAGQKGDVMAAGVDGLSYKLRDSRGNEILKGTARVNALGGFDTVFKLPPTMNLGFGQLELQAAGSAETQSSIGHHNIRVQEFRRPEYEVKTTVSEGPHFVRGHAVMTLAANYYAGGALTNAEVTWNVTSTPTNYTPPNRGDFIFGKWMPWWRPYYEGQAGRSESYSARTDASGKHHLRIDFDSVDPPRPSTLTVVSNVQDVNRQSVGSTTTMLVHSGELYVGLRVPRMFVQQGEPLVVESIATDIDGKLIINREIRMRAALLDWVYDKGEWRERETSPEDCVVKSGEKPVTCRFEPKAGGRYRITATIMDDRERRNETEVTLWVAGGKQPPQRNLAKESIELIPDRKEYQSGETAEILVQAPFFPADGIMTIRRSGLVTSERFTMTGASHTLKIPISEQYVSNINVQVDLVGASSRTDETGKTDVKLPKRPAFASGELNLEISTGKRKLTVAATPRDKAIEPGGETTVDLEVRDAAGKPVQGGEVALVVVDEAVLALSNYQLADPLKTFYEQRGADVSDHHLREKVLLAKGADLISQQGGQQGTIGKIAMNEAISMDAMAAATPAPQASFAREALSKREMSKEDRDQQVPEPIRTRIDFNALALFAPALPTDANGRASVKVKLPDNLTRYRVMAVAATGDKQFGTGEAAITARLPLMVRPSAPRFLNFGDKFELPVVVQNQTDAAMQVDVAVRMSNAQLTAGAGRRVTVPANDRVEVRFPSAASKPGTARFQIAGASTQNGGKWSDSAEVSLPVWTPATTEAFATYGEVDAGAIIQPIKAPSDAIKQFGGLEVSTSSTQLQALTDAVIYLTSYPYECAEQIASRVLAIAALRDVLSAFDARGLPKPDELVAGVQRDIKRLQGLQNEDGGFGFWRRHDESWPFISIHVAHTLQRAKEKHFDVPPETLEKSKAYLRNVEQRIPGWYSPETRRAVIAYALYTRNRMGDRDASRARRLIDEAGGLGKLSLEAIGWIYPVLSGNAASSADVASIRRHLANRAEETAGAAHFTTSYSDGAHLLLHSSRRVDGIILEGLIGDDPKNDRGLLAHRKEGRWQNTQENAFILLALDRYFATYEKVTPDFIARAWLGDAYAGSHKFSGRTTDSHEINVPMSYLAGQGSAQNFILSKEGAGRLYYRIGMQYAPASLQLKAADYGFAVTRIYEAIDNANDVRREEDGTWRIKAGAQVRVRLTMVAQARRYHVALVDPLPAGFEAMNPELATTGNIPLDPKDPSTGGWWWRWRQWFEHQNMRDERVEAFTSLLREGVYDYSYVARATTPGVFIVPPSKAEEMYHPETFGRGASDRVVIE